MQPPTVRYLLCICFGKRVIISIRPAWLVYNLYSKVLLLDVFSRKNRACRKQLSIKKQIIVEFKKKINIVFGFKQIEEICFSLYIKMCAFLQLGRSICATKATPGMQFVLLIWAFQQSIFQFQMLYLGCYSWSRRSQVHLLSIFCFRLLVDWKLLFYNY